MQKQKLNRIKEVIKEEGRSQLWMSRHLGMSENNLSDYCSGKREPSLELIFRIAQILQVPVLNLINPNGEVNITKMQAKKRE